MTPWTATRRLSCPSPVPGVCSNSCPLNQWCYLYKNDCWLTPPMTSTFQCILCCAQVTHPNNTLNHLWPNCLGLISSLAHQAITVSAFPPHHCSNIQNPLHWTLLFAILIYYVLRAHALVLYSHIQIWRSACQWHTCISLTLLLWAQNFIPYRASPHECLINITKHMFS